ncbi:alcohol dehydrogenase [Pararhizobium sp.]|uniref:alcohol dehydrogenase n=1 Tax=Pararhizobium sp. TaxID=1977563 RepID=UPI002D7F98C0|nr:alcohol dehydrogenase [Pararhizobium sp.]
MMRVAMSLVPINPSDLIPVTGAYSHRIQLPAIVGYEGVGRVVSAPSIYAALVGCRVLPLRSAGTWQAYVDCDPDLAVPVPDDVEDDVAARAYINPLAALTMLDRWPANGKRVLLSGAGSMCAELLGARARQQGAVEVRGIYRSESRIPRLLSAGILPVPMDDPLAVCRAAGDADLVFDSLGGPVGSAVLEAMRPDTIFVGYGLLSGQGVGRFNADVAYHRFHLRDTLATMTSPAWQSQFHRLWPKLAEASLPPVQVFPINHWREALQQAAVPGAPKSMLSFAEFGEEA